jgi:hypothetical protein
VLDAGARTSSSVAGSSRTIHSTPSRAICGASARIAPVNLPCSMVTATTS